MDKFKRLLGLLAALAGLLAFSPVASAEDYPIIAFGNRTFVAEADRTNGKVLIRVYRRTGRTTWHRYGGFMIAADELAARRAAVKRNPDAASAPERVYFTGRIIGYTPFQPSSPLYRPPRFRSKK
jgi:hypothetical protein